MKARIRRQAFTLVEMLVALSILSFMMVTMAQVAGLATRAFHVGHDSVDNFTKGRAMLDMMTGDLQRAVFRGDLPIFGTGSAQAATMTPNGAYYFTSTTFTNAFYTRTPGVPTSAGEQVRDLSLVSYSLGADPVTQKVALQRTDVPVSWTDAQTVAFQGGMSASDAKPKEMAPGVVGFRLAFRRADGTLIDQNDYTGYNVSNPVVAVDIGLTVIADQCLVKLQPGQVQAIQNALAEASLTGSVKTTWDQTTLSSSFYSQYPKELGEGLKTFERWVACPPF